jgi:hypothetical protein
MSWVIGPLYHDLCSHLLMMYSDSNLPRKVNMSTDTNTQMSSITVTMSIYHGYSSCTNECLCLTMTVTLSITSLLRQDGVSSSGTMMRAFSMHTIGGIPPGTTKIHRQNHTKKERGIHSWSPTTSPLILDTVQFRSNRQGV